MRKIIKWVLYKVIYPLYYRILSAKSVNNKKVLFVENHAGKISSNYELLYENLKNQCFDVRVHFLEVATSSWGNIIRRTFALLKDMSDARCVFLNESNSVFGVIPIRKDTQLVQLWHACGAFKKWGFSVADLPFGDDLKTLQKYSGHRNYSLVPVSGEEVCWAYEEAFGLEDRPHVVKPIGVSRTDMFFDEDRKKRAYEHLQMLDCDFLGKKIVLYAPTFRGDIKNAHTPKDFDIKKICRKFSGKYLLLIKQHPFVKERMLIPKEYKSNCVEIEQQLSIEELIMVADICITDYSSIVFEYALMNRPIYFFAPDLEQYYDERGFYYPYRDFVPGPIVTNMDEMLYHLEHIDAFDYKKIIEFRDTYMSGCDGKATKRILKEIFD